MGVSGCGKSTVGQLLADALQAPFFDGDDFHPPVNIDKQSRGIPLQDEDRWPWLHAIRESMEAQLAAGRPAVYACSALKASYRAILMGKDPDARFHLVYLRGTPAQIRERLQRRSGHFMPLSLLDSQFEALEAPNDAWTLSITHSPAEMVAEILARMKTHNV